MIAIFEPYRDELAVPIQPAKLPTHDWGYIQTIDGNGEPLEESRISGEIDGIAAYRKAVWKTFCTPRYMYPDLYPDSHGSEFHKLIGRSPAYARARIPQMAHDCLSQDERFIGVRILSITQPMPKNLRVSMLITATVGELNFEHDVPILK